MTELDRKIQEMALKNWQQFVAVIGEDAIKRAKICLLRQEGVSHNGVAIKLGISLDQARYQQRCNHCDSLANAGKA